MLIFCVCVYALTAIVTRLIKKVFKRERLLNVYMYILFAFKDVSRCYAGRITRNNENSNANK